MNVVYACEEFPATVTKMLFIAGPTPRDQSVQSWRPEVLKELKAQGYDGTVFVPEPKNGRWRPDYNEQIAWEEAALNRADAILFWIPRNMKDLPGLTTNDEWGYWKAVCPTKLVLGIPDNAEKINYQKYYAEKFEIDLVNNLQDAVSKVIEKIGTGIERNGQECFFPIDFWKNKSFIYWIKNYVKYDIINTVNTVFTSKSKVKNSKYGKFSLFILDVSYYSESSHSQEKKKILFSSRKKYPQSI